MEAYKRILYIADADWRCRIDGQIMNRLLVNTYNAAKIMEQTGQIKNLKYHSCSDVNSAIKYRLFRGIGIKHSIILSLVRRKKIGEKVCFIIAEANREAEREMDKRLNKKHGREKIFI